MYITNKKFQVIFTFFKCLIDVSITISFFPHLLHNRLQRSIADVY